MEILIPGKKNLEKFTRCWDEALKNKKKIDNYVSKYGRDYEASFEIELVKTSKARSRHAQVNPTLGRLVISEHMFSVSDKELVTTLLHELCHCYKKAGHGHGRDWKFYADIASRLSGLTITRCRNVEGYNDNLAERRAELVRKSGLVFKCITCGQVVTRTRRSRFTESYESYRCGRCGGKFEKV